MNERIRELAEEAGAEFFEDKGIQILPNGIWKATKFENHKNLDLEKFAELLVADITKLCADIDGGENMFSRAIRKEYGVN